MEVNFSLNQIDATAKELLAEAGNRKVLAFHGEMGAGKTTFINALCRVMGVEDVVSSPLFPSSTGIKQKTDRQYIIWTFTA